MRVMHQEKRRRVMWAAVISVFLVLSVPTQGIQTVGCNNTRAAVLECVSQLLDLDHDGTVTPVEVAVALSTTFTFVPDWLKWQFVMRCDMNSDGVLDMLDWAFNPPNRTCLPTQNCLNIACSVCSQNGFVQAKRAASEQPPPLPASAFEQKTVWRTATKSLTTHEMQLAMEQERLHQARNQAEDRKETVSAAK